MLPTRSTAARPSHTSCSTITRHAHTSRLKSHRKRLARTSKMLWACSMCIQATMMWIFISCRAPHFVFFLSSPRFTMNPQENTLRGFLPSPLHFTVVYFIFISSLLASPWQRVSCLALVSLDVDILSFYRGWYGIRIKSLFVMWERAIKWGMRYDTSRAFPAL